MIRSPFLFGVLAASGVFLSTGASAAPPLLPEIDGATVTISGISSGAAMAQQLHLAYGDRISASGLIAGVPAGCAEGQLGLALGRCMGNDGSEIPVDELVDAYRAAAERGDVASLENLDKDRAWIFHGTLDAAVGASATEASVALYEALLPAEGLQYVNDIPAAHHFPTLSSGVPCDQSAAPWLGACNYDAAGAMLSHLYPGLETPSSEQRAAPVEERLFPVVVRGAAAAGLAEEAFLFVPEACPEGGCKMHVALHGCAMSAAQNGPAFIQDSGYLPWARANGIVVAFPQVVPQAVNPLGCWDWWGYTGSNYLDRDGAQMKVLADWIDGLVQR